MMDRDNDVDLGEHGAGETAVDARNRGLAQEAGLDRDLESQVPPIYGRFSAMMIAALAIAAISTLIWIML